MIRLPLIALCAVLASCASKPAPSSIVPPAPPRAVPVAPEVSKLRDQLADALDGRRLSVLLPVFESLLMTYSETATWPDNHAADD